MVRVECCGGQDRSSTTSSLYPDTPTLRTKNCYLSDSNGDSKFDYMNCDGQNSACSEIGGNCQSCKASDNGGYCEVNNKFYTSDGGGLRFRELDNNMLMEMYNDIGNDNNQNNINKVIFDYDRILTNKLRELQILGTPLTPLTPRDPPKPTKVKVEKKVEKKVSPKKDKDNFWSYLLYFFLFLMVQLLIVSIILILIKHKTIVL